MNKDYMYAFIFGLVGVCVIFSVIILSRFFIFDTYAAETATAGITLDTDSDSSGGIPEIEEPDDFPESASDALGASLYSEMTDTEKLSSIEYSLRVISGGVVLAICSAFIWFTVLKPLKSFTDF